MCGTRGVADAPGAKGVPEIVKNAQRERGSFSCIAAVLLQRKNGRGSGILLLFFGIEDK